MCIQTERRFQTQWSGSGGVHRFRPLHLSIPSFNEAGTGLRENPEYESGTAALFLPHSRGSASMRKARAHQPCLAVHLPEHFFSEDPCYS